MSEVSFIGPIKIIAFFISFNFCNIYDDKDNYDDKDTVNTIDIDIIEDDHNKVMTSIKKRNGW